HLLISFFVTRRWLSYVLRALPPEIQFAGLSGLSSCCRFTSSYNCCPLCDVRLKAIQRFGELLYRRDGSGVRIELFKPHAVRLISLQGVGNLEQLVENVLRDLHLLDVLEVQVVPNLEERLQHVGRAGEHDITRQLLDVPEPGLTCDERTLPHRAGQ